MGKVLTLLEVSQKQAYIFASNKLSDNITRSGEIAEITGTEYMQRAIDRKRDLDLDIKKQLVYTGGGHTILEFEDMDTARQAASCITGQVMRDLPEIELFAASVPYDEGKTPGENVKTLTAALEKKKSLRISSFHQGSFGIERTDTDTGRPVRVKANESIWSGSDEKPEDGFGLTYKFEDLGGTKGSKNFIAVVHIDGNSMGKRVEALAERYQTGQWDEYKKEMRQFSEGIAEDFKSAYMEMRAEVAASVLNALHTQSGPVASLSVRFDKGVPFLPVRRVIAEGDDICFVSEGRIGLECAALFLKKLAEKKNVVDGKTYAACAGVALVHQKYPFYRAYELAEELCSNAKRFGVTLGAMAAGEGDGTESGAAVSAIDWHIEYGEVQDSLEETRKQYICRDGANLALRPYIVLGPEDLCSFEKVRNYKNFRKLEMLLLQDVNKEDSYSSGRLKELRSILKKGRIETENYLRFHKIEELGRDFYQDIYTAVDYDSVEIGSGKKLDRKVFAKTADGKERCLIFDAIEMMDTFIPLEEDPT